MMSNLKKVAALKFDLYMYISLSLSQYLCTYNYV